MVIFQAKPHTVRPVETSVQALIKNGNEKSIMPIHLSSEDDLYHQENDNQCQGLLLCLCVVWRPLLELDSRIDGCCCFITVCKAQDKLILFLLILAWKNHQVKTLQKPFILMENEIFCCVLKPGQVSLFKVFLSHFEPSDRFDLCLNPLLAVSNRISLQSC